MRRRVAVLLAALIASLAGGCSDGDGGMFSIPDDVVGSGVIVTEQRLVSGFETVMFASEGSLDIVMGAAEGLSITTDDNIQPHLITQVHSGLLSIRTASGVDVMPSETIEFDLTAVNLQNVQHMGVGGVEIHDLSGGSLQLTQAGVGGLTATGLDLNDVETVKTGVGSVTLSGSAGRQDVTVGGVGDYDARDLSSTEATVLLTSGGMVVVRVSDLLDVTIVGSGVVQYIGDPTLTLDITGTGRVEQIPG